MPVGPIAPAPSKVQCRIPAELKTAEPITEFPNDPVDAKAAITAADKLHETAVNERVLRFKAIGYAEEFCPPSNPSSR